MSLVIREMQTKATVRYHFTPTSMGHKETRLKNKRKITSVGKGAEKLELSYIIGGNVKLCTHWKTASWFFNKVNIELPQDPAIPLLSIDTE